MCPRVLAGAGSRGRGGARPRPTIGSERRSGVQESAESSLQSASATSPHHTAAMEPDKLGFRTFGFPPKPFGTEAEEKRKEETVKTIQKITSRPNSFSFNIQKFLNIKQEEEVVEDEVQEYKVTTSQNEKDRDAEDDGDKVEDQEEEDDKSGVVVDDQEDTEPSYRSLLLNTYPFPARKDSATEEDGGIWSRKLPRQKVAGDRLLDIPCKVELQTKVREGLTITEEASTRTLLHDCDIFANIRLKL